MQRDEIRRRAVVGSGLLALRGAGIQVLAFAGFLGLSLLLDPREIGQLAFGLGLVAIGARLSDGGLAASLLNGKDEPRREVLGAAFGLQLVLTTAVIITTVAIAANFGETGQVTAIMVASLVFVCARVPGIVITERHLRYRPVAVADLVDTVAFFGLAIGALLLGFGVIGVAVCAVIRAALGTAAVWWLVPEGRVSPRWDPTSLKGTVRFGLKFQATSLAGLGRDQGVNLGVAAVGGLAALGLWTLAFRTMQVPYLLFQTLRRVSWPAMARLRDSGEDLGGVVYRLAARAALAAAAVLAIVCPTAYFGIPVVFGAEWEPASAVIPWACAGLLVAGPVSVAASGCLYALGSAGRNLVAIVVSSLVWLGVALSLVPALGVVAVGIGWAFGSWTEAALFIFFVKKVTGRSIVEALWLPILCGVVAGTVGLCAGWALDGGWLGAIVGAVAALLVIAVISRLALSGLLREVVLLVAPMTRRLPREKPVRQEGGG